MAYIVKPPCDEGVIHSASATIPIKEDIGPWVLAATILGSSMAFIDSTEVNVALPILQTDLKQPSPTAVGRRGLFTLLAALILVGGSLGDSLGRQRIFALGIVLFAAASILCGFAPNVTFLIVARAIKGIGGALLVPGSLAIIKASFDKGQRGWAFGT